MRQSLFCIGILVAFILVGCRGGGVAVTSLKVEMQENPQGVSVLTPRFSWQKGVKLIPLLIDVTRRRSTG